MLGEEVGDLEVFKSVGYLLDNSEHLRWGYSFSHHDRSTFATDYSMTSRVKKTLITLHIHEILNKLLGVDRVAVLVLADEEL